MVSSLFIISPNNLALVVITIACPSKKLGEKCGRWGQLKLHDSHFLSPSFGLINSVRVWFSCPFGILSYVVVSSTFFHMLKMSETDKSLIIIQTFRPPYPFMPTTLYTDEFAKRPLPKTWTASIKEKSYQLTIRFTFPSWFSSPKFHFRFCATPWFRIRLFCTSVVSDSGVFKRKHTAISTRGFNFACWK